MYWAHFLHLYQPSEQQPDILEAVVAQSYRPLFSNLRRQTRVRCTINVNGALLDLFDRYGYRDLLDDLRAAGTSGNIEFTGSAKYHALLPFLPEEEIVRQITINNKTNHFYLGSAYQPRGFFPPEMAYTPKIGKIVADLGYEWIILDEIAHCGKTNAVNPHVIYTLKGTNLKVFFRNRRISNLVMGAFVRTRKSLLAGLHKDLPENKYLVSAMDGETFGHHRPGMEQLLYATFRDRSLTTLRVSDIANFFPRRKNVSPITSTWASSQSEISEGAQFFSWKEPGNPIHGAQQRLFRLALRAVQEAPQHHRRYETARRLMDRASASDHYWWATGKPWWSLEMIELGAYLLVEAIRATPGRTKAIVEQAERHYEKIISTGFAWQRTGYIRRLAQQRIGKQRIPFRDRAGKNGKRDSQTFRAFLALLQQQERRARRNREYEQAVLWRDAQYRLEHRLDIYDAVHAINLLETTVASESIERAIKRYRSRYSHMRGGQPEDRGG